MSVPQEFTKFETNDKDFDNKASQSKLHEKESEIAQQAKDNVKTATTSAGK